METSRIHVSQRFGFLNCRKPSGVTSRDVVNVVQRRWRGSKVGHAGTLDPLAEGVLVLGVGPAVRLVPYVQQTPKVYRATFRLGVSSPSGDLEETVTEHPACPRPTMDQLHAAADALTGRIEQTPPAHSAIWVDGRRAYERVRAGEQVEMPTRTVTVHRYRILSYDFPHVDAEISCGSGTYIRSLGIDLAAACGTVAVMTRLLRTQVGPFRLEDAVDWETLREGALDELLRSPAEGVCHLPRLLVDEPSARRLGFGQCVGGEVIEPLAPFPAHHVESDSSVALEAAAVDPQGKLRAIVQRRDDQWHPRRVFPSPASCD